MKPGSNPGCPFESKAYTINDSQEDNDYTHLAPLMEQLIEFPEKERKQVQVLLEQFSDVFSKHEFDLGCTPLMQHHIDTGTARPIRQGLRRHPQVHLDAIDEQVDKMLQAGLIEPSSSPWASNVVLVKKAEVGAPPRVTIDYRALNLVTYKDAYPLPNINACLDALEGCTYFSTLDLRSGFFQVPIYGPDADKTAFITRKGQFRFRVMSMGLCNSPSSFQRLLDLVLRGLTWSSCLVYVDDIIIMSKSFPDHVEHLRSVLQRIRDARLKLKVSKCHLFQPAVKFLGHIISKDGISADREKTRAITDWPVPKNISEVRSFLGTCSYYRRYVAGFATIASPLHQLTRHGEPFIWNEERQRAFDLLKTKLVSAPILAMPRDNGDFVLDVDASGTGMGAILQQKQDGILRVIAYASRTFNRQEANYCITRREMLAAVYGLKQYRQYLLGRRFTLRSDHAALTYLRSTVEPVGQQARWLNFFEEFDFELVHRAGQSHQNADGLSRRPCETDTDIDCRQCHKTKTESSLTHAVTTRRQARAAAEGDDLITENDDGGPEEPPEDEIRPGRGRARRPRARRRNGRRIPPLTSTDVVEIIKEEWTPGYLAAAQDLDEDLRCLKSWKSGTGVKPSWFQLRGASPTLKAYWQQFDSIVLQNDVLYRQFHRGRALPDTLQLLVPKSLRQAILELAHADAAGHMSARKTEGQLQPRAYWYGWKRAIYVYCQNCSICNSHHRGKPPKNGLLQPFTPGAPNERWCIDLTGEHPRSAAGYTYILTAMDCFTKYVICVPLRNKQATTVAKALVEEVFLKFGMVELHSDGGGEFDNEILKEICRLMGAAKVKTTPYEPSSNPVERFHRTMHSLIAKVVSEHQRDWDAYIDYITFCYNTSIHRSTGYTPYFLMHGTEARWNIDAVIDRKRESQNVNEYAAELLERLETAYILTRGTLDQAAAYEKSWYDRRVKEATFQDGEKVRVLDQRGYPGQTPKWQLPYLQIATVIRKLNDVTYLVTAPGWRQPRVLHVDKLRKLESAAY